MDKSEYKFCEVCGKEKHISEFSKSYPRRCKECVAEHTRMIRKRSQNAEKRSQNTENRTELPKKRTETVKARIKATGEIIELNEKVSFLDYARGIYRDTDGNKYHYNELEIFEREYEKPIDWEQRRYEIAKEMLAAIYLDDGNAERADTSKIGFEFKTVEGCAREAVRMADGLIAELQKAKRYGETEE